MKFYQVDAFTKVKFGGNPAAVVPLKNWLDDDILQKIALEFNLSETAYIVPKGDDFELRWFTPMAEVRLCGHATLATSHVIFNHLGYEKDTIKFYTKAAGELLVSKKGASYILNFPEDIARDFSSDYVDDLVNKKVIESYAGIDDLMLVLKDEESVRNCVPNLNLMTTLENRAVIITAPGNDVDFVSRVFAPALDINEDPVTGSAHTVMTPYWAKRLGKNDLTAIQVSARRGDLLCTWKEGRVYLQGDAITVMKGEIL